MNFPFLSGMSDQEKKTIFRWLIIGLIIRLVLIPFTASLDLIRFLERIDFITYHGGSAFTINGQELIYKVEELFFKIFSLFLNDRMFHPLSYDNVITTNIPRLLFFAKLPNLIFEAGTIFLLISFFSKARDKIILTMFLVLNPINIYALYLWGRYESIAIFVLFLSLAFAKKEKISISAFLLGIAGALRFYPFLFLPFYLIFLGKSVKQKLEILLWSILPLAIVQIITQVSSQRGFEDHGHFLLQGGILRGQGTILYLFVIAFILLIFYAAFEVSKQNNRFNNLMTFSFLTLLSFFATSFFHPQYVAWLIPFIGIAFISNPKFLKLHAIQILAFFGVIFYWGDNALNFILAPIDFNYFTSFSLNDILQRSPQIANFIKISASIFSAATIYMIYLKLKDVKKT